MNYVTSFERIGIEKGIEIGSAGIVLRMSKNRFGSLDEAAEARVRRLSLAQIEALTDAPPDLAAPTDLRTLLLHPSTCVGGARRQLNHQRLA